MNTDYKTMNIEQLLYAAHKIDPHYTITLAATIIDAEDQTHMKEFIREVLVSYLEAKAS